VGFNAADQLMITFSAFIRYWRKKSEYNETVHQLVIDIKKACKINALSEFLFNFALKYAIRKVN
jgi:hypothetical protein